MYCKKFSEAVTVKFLCGVHKAISKEIILNFPESINEKDFDFDKLDIEERDKTLRYMRVYFDLCSEEYCYLWKSSFYDNKTWKEVGEWHKICFFENIIQKWMGKNHNGYNIL